jgi:hypothetical protein
MSPPAKKRLNFSTIQTDEVKKARSENAPSTSQDLMEFHLDGEDTGWFLIIFQHSYMYFF